MRFKKKPIEIEARQFTGGSVATEIVEWIRRGNFAARHRAHRPEIKAPNGELAQMLDPEHISIRTLEGDMRADLGDWIICGVKGEFYPCKPDIFEATYEAVE